MTTIDTARHVVVPARWTRVLPGIVAAVADWNDRQATRKVLGKLSNRELDDVGLMRGDIDAI